MTAPALVTIGQTVLQSLAPQVRPILDSFSATIRTDKRYKDIENLPVYGRKAGTTARYNDESNNFGHENGIIGWKPVTFDKRYKATWAYEDFEAGRINEQPAAIEGAGIIFDDMLEDLFGLVLAVNYSKIAVNGVAAADFGADDLTTCLAFADTEKHGRTRSMVLGSAYYNQLLQIYGAANSNQANITREGDLGRLMGFNTIKATVPANGEKLAGFIADRSALVVGFGGVVAEGLLSVDTDPDTNLTLYTYEWVDGKTRKRYVSTEMVCGFAVGTGNLGRITSP